MGCRTRESGQLKRPDNPRSKRCAFFIEVYTHMNNDIVSNRDAGYRAAICERKNNRTGATEWCVRFTRPALPLKHSEVAWFSLPAGATWITDPTEHRYFAAFLNQRFNISVKCQTIRQAAEFLERLRPAQVGEEAASPDDE
jgi:hypothetical protein